MRRPAPPAPRWPAWAAILPRHIPRLAFPMFVVVAAAPSVVAMGIPLGLLTAGMPAMSGLFLGMLAIALTWGGLAILMRYQEGWESSPPLPTDPWQPPAEPEHVRAVFS